VLAGYPITGSWRRACLLRKTRRQHSKSDGTRTVKPVQTVASNEHATLPAAPTLVDDRLFDHQE